MQKKPPASPSLPLPIPPARPHFDPSRRSAPQYPAKNTTPPHSPDAPQSARPSSLRLVPLPAQPLPFILLLFLPLESAPNPCSPRPDFRVKSHRRAKQFDDDAATPQSPIKLRLALLIFYSFLLSLYFHLFPSALPRLIQPILERLPQSLRLHTQSRLNSSLSHR